MRSKALVFTAISVCIITLHRRRGMSRAICFFRGSRCFLFVPFKLREQMFEPELGWKAPRWKQHFPATSRKRFAPRRKFVRRPD